MRLKFLLLSFLFTTSLLSDENLLKKDFDYFIKLENSQKSYENTITTLENISNVNKIIFDEYAKKIDYDETLAVSQCMNASAKSLVSTNSDCIAVGLDLKKALTLSHLELNSTVLKIEDSYPVLAKELKIINSPIPFTKLVSSSKEIIYDLYLNATNSFLYDKLNYRLPTKTMQKIKDDKRFEKLLSLVISNPKLNFLQSSFLDFDDSESNYNISFILALNRVLNKKLDEQTTKYFQNALSKALTQYEKDKVNFWLYLLNKDTTSLNSLKESDDLNIYTLYIKETTQIDNSFKTLKYDFLKGCTKEQTILINSYAKTLSSFDENKISSEFDLGLMQINLRKADLISLFNNLDAKRDELLIPKINILYYSYIFNELKVEFSHPLMQFYAYIYDVEYLNDRLNFDLFKIKSNYKPYLSLELFGNESAKEFIYNYIIYTKIIGKKDLSLEEFFKNLFQPLEFD
ncbi:transglycosylase SLT domain-containing protein [uncultured Arcobacter sp.]|uniref:transglycosylase SLT domain-containing protein n=1 Tax=uncultured Arcobacter sp. TaxID=165434 RepID=UPI00261751D2|nr:transglycosylase SLT domain-containing protein [uncultured Arcobacter sp.]